MLARISKGLSWVTITLNVVGTGLVLMLVAMINFDVASMNLRGQPIVGVKESVGLSIAVIVFLQMAETLRTGRHIRSDMWLSHLKKRRPRLGGSLDALFHMIGAALMALIAYYCIPLFQSAYAGGYFFGAPGVFTLPTWPSFAIVVLCATVTALQFLVTSAQCLWEREDV
ncbi:MAG: TRAP transporter small permease [Pseudomonadota bacterium]